MLKKFMQYLVVVVVVVVIVVKVMMVVVAVISDEKKGKIRSRLLCSFSRYQFKQHMRAGTVYRCET